MRGEQRSGRGTVWHGKHRVGVVSEGNDGRIQLAYDEAWLANGFPISLRLPLTSTQAQDAHPFFTGLLPEGAARERIVRSLRVGPDDDFGLLLAIGADGAGALTVLPEHEHPQDHPPVPTPFAHDDLDTLVRSRGQVIGSSTAPLPRFSLAGTQHKASAIYDGHAYFWPDARHPSSHILKFETVRWVCFAEHVAHDMARRAGLAASRTEHLLHDGEDAVPYLRIERYDRLQMPDGTRVRLHQEDMTQALGYESHAKYEEHGGPSLAAVSDLVRRHSKDPVGDLAALRDWQIFNYLIGNSDGHAKNLSLLYHFEESVPTLAPFYDLVSIEFIVRIRAGTYHRAMAFRIGDHTVPEEVRRADWNEFARDMGLPPKPTLRRLEEMALLLPDMARDTRQAFATSFGDNQVYDRFEETVRDRCHWVCTSVLAAS